MRTVTLDISRLHLQIGDTINLKLVNSVGDVCTAQDGYSLDEDITISANHFTKELLENSFVGILSFYKLTLPSSAFFNFMVPFSEENEAHELSSLLSMACLDECVYIDTESLNPNYFEKLDRYFMGEPPYFSVAEQDMTDLYAFYADDVIETTSTIDIANVMDSYLGSLVES